MYKNRIKKDGIIYLKFPALLYCERGNSERRKLKIFSELNFPICKIKEGESLSFLILGFFLHPLSPIVAN